MRKTRSSIVQLLRLVLSICVTRSLFGTTPTYNVTVIPLPAGQGLIAYPLGINNSGQVVGVILIQGDGSKVPFIGTASGFTFIPLPAGYDLFPPGQLPVGINDSGQVATTLIGTINGTGPEMPVVETISGFTPIPLLPSTACSKTGCTSGWFGGFASSINNSGQVVGAGSYVFVSSNQQSVIENTLFVGNVSGVTPIPAPSGWNVGLTGVNNAGQVVGYGSQAGSTTCCEALFIGDIGGVTPIPTPEGTEVFSGSGGVVMASQDHISTMSAKWRRRS